MRVQLETKIGLSDSEPFLVSIKDDELQVLIKAWNESKILFEFKDFVHLNYGITATIDSVWEVEVSDEQMKTALTRVYDKVIPEEHPYRCFQFMDLEDTVAIEVIAAELTIHYID